MTYVMAYVGSVPDDRKADYIEKTRLVAEVFREHGALRVVECWGDMVPPGEVTSFPMAVKAEPGETVVYGWQEWPDRETQQANMQAAMADERLKGFSDMPIDGKRMIFAGFEVVADV